MYTNRGVARNLLRGWQKRGLGEVPQRGPGAEPRWGSGDEAPRSWRHTLNIRLNKAIYRSSQIAYCSESDYTFEKISSYDGGTCTLWLRHFTQNKDVFF